MNSEWRTRCLNQKINLSDTDNDLFDMAVNQNNEIKKLNKEKEELEKENKRIMNNILSGNAEFYINGNAARLTRNGIILANMPKFDKSTIKLVNFNKDKGITVVKWTDNTVTKVVVQNGDKWNPELGLAMCIIKHLCGDKGNYNDIFNTWVKEEDF